MSPDQWIYNPELRNSVERELDNWGLWSRGGGTDLGYPHQVAGASPPERDPPAPCNIEQAEQTEAILTSWKQEGDAGDRMTFLLKLCHVERLPIEAITTHYERKYRHYIGESVIDATIDEARMVYWLRGLTW